MWGSSQGLKSLALLAVEKHPPPCLWEELSELRLSVLSLRPDIRNLDWQLETRDAGGDLPWSVKR